MVDLSQFSFESVRRWMSDSVQITDGNTVHPELMHKLIETVGDRDFVRRGIEIASMIFSQLIHLFLGIGTDLTQRRQRTFHFAVSPIQSVEIDYGGRSDVGTFLFQVRMSNESSKARRRHGLIHTCQQITQRFPILTKESIEILSPRNGHFLVVLTHFDPRRIAQLNERQTNVSLVSFSTTHLH